MFIFSPLLGFYSSFAEEQELGDVVIDHPGGNTQSIRLIFQGEPGEEHAIEFNTDITTPFWPVVNINTTDPDGLLEYVIPASTNNYLKFYRVSYSVDGRPEATTSLVEADEDLPVTFTLEAADPVAPTGSLLFVITALPAKGSLLQFDETPVAFVPAPVTDEDSRLIFLGDQDENGTPYTTFSYYAQRAQGGAASLPQQVVIHVAPVNDQPLTTTTRVDTQEDVPVLFQLEGDDPDLYHEGDSLVFKVNFTPALGTLFQVLEDHTTPADEIADDTFVSNSEGWVYYMPPTNMHGMPLLSFTYQVWDSHDLGSVPKQVPIYVEPVNDPPTAADTVVVIPGDWQGPREFSFFWQDIDGDTNVTLFITGMTGRGRIFTTPDAEPFDEISMGDLPYSTVISPASFFYFVRDGGLDCPGPDEGATNYLVMDFYVQDSGGLTSEFVSVVFDVETRLLPPEPTRPLNFTGIVNGLLRTEAGYEDPQELDAIMTLIKLPEHGALYAGGNPDKPNTEGNEFAAVPVNLPKNPAWPYYVVFYEPDPDFIGEDSFEYTIINSLGIEICEPLIVGISVLPSNVAPVVSGPDELNGTIVIDPVEPFASAIDVTGVSVEDSDAIPGNLVRMTLAVSWPQASDPGHLKLNSTNDLQDLTGDETATISFAGTLIQINAAFEAGFVYQLPLLEENPVSNPSLSITANDQHDAAPNGPQEHTLVIPVYVTIQEPL